jgi:hypothetical protein
MVEICYGYKAILFYIAVISVAVCLVICVFNYALKEDTPVTVSMVDELVEKISYHPNPDKGILFKLLKLCEVMMKTIEAKLMTAQEHDELPTLHGHLRGFYKLLLKLQPNHSLKAWVNDGMRLRDKAKKYLIRFVDAMPHERGMPTEEYLTCRDKLLASIAAYDDGERHVITSIHPRSSLDDFPADKIIEETILLSVFKDSSSNACRYGESFFALVTRIADQPTRLGLLQKLKEWYASEDVNLEESNRFELWKKMFPASFERMMKNGMDCFGSSLRAIFYLSEIKAAGFTIIELKAAGFSLKELKHAGFIAGELKSTNYRSVRLTKFVRYSDSLDQ